MFTEDIGVNCPTQITSKTQTRKIKVVRTLQRFWEGGNPGWGGGGRGRLLLGLLFAGYVLLASQNPCPIIVYSVAML